MRKLVPLPGKVIVSVIDLEERVDTSADGTRFRYQVDPKTNLPMAPDCVHPPVGVVVGTHAAFPILDLGTRVLVQRDLGRQMLFEGMRVMEVSAGEQCGRCGTLLGGCGGVPAYEHNGEWRPCDGWVLVELCRVAVDKSQVIAVEHPGVDVGRVLFTDHSAEPPLDKGQVVCFNKSGGVRWSEGGTDYVALHLHVHCPLCGMVLQHADVDARLEGVPVEATSRSYAK